MRYYTIQDNNIYIADNEETLARYYENILELPEDYETGKYIVEEGVLVLNPDYEDEQTAIREENFKSQFFEIPGYGWYRKVPKGYSSAVESFIAAARAVDYIHMLPADTLIFYQEPDFTKPEECTEEWLVEHQIFNEQMTEQEFGQLYMIFMQAWNTQEHVNLGE